MLEVITTKNEWDRIIKGFKEIDFYHLYDYHQVDLNNDESAQLLFYHSGRGYIAFPLILRPINNSEYFDLTSVYGYVGPLVSNINHVDLVAWHKELLQYFIQNRIVSAFSSLNPFISCQIDLLKNIGVVENLGNIIYIDLETQKNHLKEYSATTKRYVKRNRKLFEVREGKTQEDANLFMEIYYQSMDRIQADSYYYFKLPYFIRLIQSRDLDAHFVFAHSRDTGEIGAGALIISSNDHLIHYHLSATAEKYRHLSPIRTVIDHVRQKGVTNNFKYFNLGGGVSSSYDTLFKFKSSFSKNIAPFKVWKLIANQKVYDELCKKNSSIRTNTNPNYFPEYRDIL